MRIRKRQLPFLLPVAISDPLFNLNRPPPVPVVVQLDHHHVSCDAVSPHHPDRPIVPGDSTDGCDFISNKEDSKEKRVGPELLFEDQDEKEKGNDIRKESISSAKTIHGFDSKSSPEHSLPPSQVPIPPKKRARIPKKQPGKNDDVLDEQESKKKAGAVRGGALMEGSRCSRVNGRGWRCCQQTLVGYSLCEHHLGKGRLRSITSVRSRSLTKSNISSSSTIITAATNISTTASSARVTEEEAVVLGNDKEGVDFEETDSEKTKSGKKRMKLGMVKARSISSLLGQTSNGSSGAISTPAHYDDQYSK